MTQTLYRKYRPKTFAEIQGQAHVVRTLAGSIKNNRVGHAYLFTGPRGTGKTTLARLFAKAINCLDLKESGGQIEPCNQCANCQLILKNQTLDLLEIDAASHTGVDNIRELQEKIFTPPANLKFKIYIIDEVHMLSSGAFNALLKTLEEPPAHAIFILATTELHKVPETVISRCQRFDITRLTKDQIMERLERLARQEGVQIEKEAQETIALEAEGGMRDAESLLGQIISLEDEKITGQEVQDILGTSSKKQLIDFFEYISRGQVQKALEKITALQTDGINLTSFNKNFLSYLRDLLTLKVSSGQNENLKTSLSQENLEKSANLLENISLKKLLALIDLFQAALIQAKDASIPALPLEMAVIKFNLEQQNWQIETKSPNQNQANLQNGNNPEVKNSSESSAKVGVENNSEIQNNPKTGADSETESSPQIENSPQKKTLPPVIPAEGGLPAGRQGIQNAPNSSNSLPTREQVALRESDNNKGPEDSSTFSSPDNSDLNYSNPETNYPPPESYAPAGINPNQTPSESPNKNSNENNQTPAASAAPKVNFGEFLDQWSLILQEVKNQNLSVHALLSNSIPGKILGGALYIKTAQEFSKKQLGQINNKIIIQEAIAKIIGAPLKVNFLTKVEFERNGFDQIQTQSQAQPQAPPPDPVPPVPAQTETNPTPNSSSNLGSDSESNSNPNSNSNLDSSANSVPNPNPENANATPEADPEQEQPNVLHQAMQILGGKIVSEDGK